MNNADMKKYRTSLMKKREEIIKNSRQRDEICVVGANDEIDRIQLAGEREFAVLSMERESKILAQVGEALRRMDDGEFGVCMECEEPISTKRLAAVPWAAYCLQCQEVHDSKRTVYPFEPLIAA